MVLTATRGAIGFLSRLPVGHGEPAWDAFVRTPVAFPLTGYVLGLLITIPLLAPLPAPTVAFLFVVGVYVVTGINHLDGVADLGDAAVVHGGPDERRAVMTDTVVGVGGAFAIVAVVFGLGAVAFQLAHLSMAALVLVVVAEVGAKAAMALLVCFGSAPHEGLGSSFTSSVSRGAMLPVVAVAVPAVGLAWPRIAPAIVTLIASLVAGFTVFRWANANLGGVSGDVLGATNEFARLAALHVGVVAWMHL